MRVATEAKAEFLIWMILTGLDIAETNLRKTVKLCVPFLSSAIWERLSPRNVADFKEICLLSRPSFHDLMRPLVKLAAQCREEVVVAAKA
jgi:hypothetical protein